MQKYLSYSSNAIVSFTKDSPISPLSIMPLYLLLDLHFPDLSSLITLILSLVYSVTIACFFQYMLLLSNLCLFFLYIEKESDQVLLIWGGQLLLR